MSDRHLARRAGTVLAGAAAAAMLVAGCGDDSPEEPDGGGTSPTAAGSPSHTGQDMDAMVMNDPDATPADELPDATEAAFTVLDTAPPGSDAVAGTAWIAFGDDPGTTLTVRLTGLEPGTEYVGHLHAMACAADNGGPHFKFDPDGAELPPNEIHIGFTAGDDGSGTATITNPQPAEAAASVVIHPADAMDNRLVCADM